MLLRQERSLTYAAGTLFFARSMKAARGGHQVHLIEWSETRHTPGYPVVETGKFGRGSGSSQVREYSARMSTGHTINRLLSCIAISDTSSHAYRDKFLEHRELAPVGIPDCDSRGLLRDARTGCLSPALEFPCPVVSGGLEKGGGLQGLGLDHD